LYIFIQNAHHKGGVGPHILISVIRHHPINNSWDEFSKLVWAVWVKHITITLPPIDLLTYQHYTQHTHAKNQGLLNRLGQNQHPYVIKEEHLKVNVREQWAKYATPPGTSSMKILMKPSSLTDPKYWTIFLCFSLLCRAISSWSGWE